LSLLNEPLVLISELEPELDMVYRWWFHNLLKKYFAKEHTTCEEIDLLTYVLYRLEDVNVVTFEVVLLLLEFAKLKWLVAWKKKFNKLIKKFLENNSY
jgi:hypothetical protein